MSGPADKLTEYRARRDFSRTAEPRGEAAGDRQTGLVFSIQKHAATRLHYDLRLEWNGVLLSWAVTRGPSADPGQKRLAVRTEDHPFDYARFEGTIPKGEYGGGTVMLWDEGTWTPTVDVDAGLAAGSLKMVLAGARMRGGWALVRMKPRKGDKRENWLLIKERDAAASDAADGLTADHDTSVRTGRSMDEIARDAPAKSRPASGQGGRRPAFRKVQLATLVSDPPGGEDWLHETKFDGYRCLAALGKGGPRLYTRGGKDWTDRFASLEGAFDALDCASALIDGEIVAARVAGSAFSSLQEALADGGPLVFHAFDLLSLDGEDLADRPQTERRDRLSALLGACPPGGALQLS